MCPLGMCQSSCFCDWRYILYKCVFVVYCLLIRKWISIFCLCTCFSKQRLKLYLLYPTHPASRSRSPISGKDESPPVKRHCKFFYTDFTSPIPDEFSGSFSVALFCWRNSGRKSMAGFWALWGPSWKKFKGKVLWLRILPELLKRICIFLFYYS